MRTPARVFFPSGGRGSAPERLTMRILRLTAPLVLPAALALGAAPAAAQSLRGSPASIDRMYNHARNNDLTFFRTGTGVRGAAEDGDLVRMSGNDDYRLSGVSYPYVLASTRTFVQRLGAQYREVCGEKLVITSGIRPTTLRLSNSTDRSVHPTGMAIDIRKPQGGRCLAWLRETLLYLEGQGVIEATEERRPPHFHIAVYPGPYRRYVSNSGGSGESSGSRSASASRPSSSGSSSRSSSSSSSASRGSASSSSRTAAASRTTYRVRSGDSLWTIARRHDTTVDRLREANDMRGNRIVAGQVLIIPAR
jgi:nucleoid-associated protein YgaU